MFDHCFVVDKFVKQWTSSVGHHLEVAVMCVCVRDLCTVVVDTNLSRFPGLVAGQCMMPHCFCLSCWIFGVNLSRNNTSRAILTHKMSCAPSIHTNQIALALKTWCNILRIYLSNTRGSLHLQHKDPNNLYANKSNVNWSIIVIYVVNRNPDKRVLAEMGVI